MPDCITNLKLYCHTIFGTPVLVLQKVILIEITDKLFVFVIHTCTKFCNFHIYPLGTWNGINAHGFSQQIGFLPYYSCFSSEWKLH